MKSYKRDGNNRIVYSKYMKLIELIDADYELLTIFLRMDIQLPFGDVSVEEMCQRYDMSPTLFLMICQIYACPDFEPDVEALGKDDLRHILRYLRASHRYYLESVLPTIAKGVERVLEGCDAGKSEILRKFYGDYADEVRTHLSYEEAAIFPYIEGLADGAVCQKSMSALMAQHTNICDKIDDIKSIIIKYLPESCSTHERCDVLFDLFRMRDDLDKHTLIELKLLTPMVIAQERRLQR